ncbi:MAG TPA: SRPBCC family protein [Solirubrobacterales bacterium]|nr:SRPBCC family protein [Solirubrobacterales bacterium]
MASFTFTREIDAPAETVFEVLTDHRRYSELTPLRKSVLEREGSPDPNGLGAIRKLTAVGPPMREEVIAFEAPSRFSYTVLSGLPVRDHVGTVELTDEGGRTKMVYAVRTQPTLPVVGPVVVAAIKQGIKGLIGGVAAESERRSSAADG